MKTDNSNLHAKLGLRRYFLRKYHKDDRPNVLDCCQGDGVLWSHLRQEFECDYWGVDLKPKRGRLKIDSVRILQQPGLPQNVIDVDTYGSPWRHWVAVLPNVIRPTTVFLTIGQISMGTSKVLHRALGFGSMKIPPALAQRLHDMGIRYVLALAYDHGLSIVEACEADPGRTARYFGVRIQPN